METHSGTCMAAGPYCGEGHWGLQDRQGHKPFRGKRQGPGISVGCGAGLKGLGHM